jgi:hypothetical protein
MRTKDFLITAIVLFITLSNYAQTVPPCPTCPGGVPPPPPGAPIDGNIWFLYGSAILLAFYQLIISIKNKKTQSKI